MQKRPQKKEDGEKKERTEEREEAGCQGRREGKLNRLEKCVLQIALFLFSRLHLCRRRRPQVFLLFFKPLLRNTRGRQVPRAKLRPLGRLEGPHREFLLVLLRVLLVQVAEEENATCRDWGHLLEENKTRRVRIRKVRKKMLPKSCLARKRGVASVKTRKEVALRSALHGKRRLQREWNKRPNKHNSPRS